MKYLKEFKETNSKASFISLCKKRYKLTHATTDRAYYRVKSYLKNNKTIELKKFNKLQQEELYKLNQDKYALFEKIIYANGFGGYTSQWQRIAVDIRENLEKLQHDFKKLYKDKRIYKIEIYNN